MTDRNGSLLEQWFSAADVGLALVGTDGRVLRENDALRRIAGRDAAQLVADPAVAAALGRALAGQPAPPVTLADPSDPLRGVRVSLLTLPDAVALTAVAVSDEQILQATLGLALEDGGTGSWVWHVDDDEVHWSPNLGPLHGLERGAAPRTYAAWLAGVHPDDRERVDARVRAALAGDAPFAFDLRVCGADGETRWLQARAAVLRHADGRPRAVAGLSTDITERKRREEASELLARAGLALTESLDPDTMLERLVALVVPALAGWCAAELASGDDGAVKAVRSCAGDEELAAGRAREPAPGGTGRSIAVPIAGHDRAFGTIELVQAPGGRSYDARDRELAEELGRRAGLALEHAALHRFQREANRRLRDLQAVTDVALTHLELDALLGELLDRLGEVLEADVAKVLLRDERGDALRVRASRGLRPQAARKLRVPLGAGAAGRIAAAGRPLVLADTGHADVVLDDLREPGRSLAGVPLRLGTDVIGVLVVSSRERAYAEDDLRLLELVADRAARAIRQAELYEAARDAALSLQRGLLPEALPTIDGVEASAQYLPGQDGADVGGDWYDLFELPDGRLAIVVGDVVGRGLRAAVRMGRIRAALRAYAFESDAPAEAVERMDRLVAAEDAFEFTTLLAVYLDPATGAAVACSAGHLPPLLVDGGGARLAEVAAGPPLGLAEGRRAQTELDVPRETFLVAYTDGLVEERATGLEAGTRRLLEAAAEGGGARELVDRIVERLVVGSGSDDDVAIVAVGRVAAGMARTFAAEPGAVPVVRGAVAGFARAHGVPDDVVADIALAVSEACTNVVLHAYPGGERGPMHVTARRDDDGLEVVVTDEGGGVRPRPDSPGIGLGLQIIARTTERFDVRDAPGGGAQLVLRFGAPGRPRTKDGSRPSRRGTEGAR